MLDLVIPCSLPLSGLILKDTVAPLPEPAFVKLYVGGFAGSYPLPTFVSSAPTITPSTTVNCAAA